MSFVTGGHVVYLEPPTASSSPHVSSGDGSTEIVFTNVPSGTNLDPDELIGSVVDRNNLIGRVLG